MCLPAPLCCCPPTPSLSTVLHCIIITAILSFISYHSLLPSSPIRGAWWRWPAGDDRREGASCCQCHGQLRHGSVTCHPWHLGLLWWQLQGMTSATACRATVGTLTYMQWVCVVLGILHTQRIQSYLNLHQLDLVSCIFCNGMIN